ncbi:unnamed protein product [Diabrotica balteata]|uniref:Uncharacterized protein n=1 Tax=Diabrotica balteata TaxID=107213 RepID=A0A9N9SN79_DIABA|nr:unnamed protein product [Diabrotica balteata]
MNYNDFYTFWEFYFGPRKMHRIFTETFESAFILCNTEMRPFGQLEIFDVMSQIIPTAFVLGTGYWSFYNTTTHEKPLCVCGRFDLPCRHNLNKNNWIDMRRLSSPSERVIFYPNRHGPVKVEDYSLLLFNKFDGERSQLEIEITFTVAETKDVPKSAMKIKAQFYYKYRYYPCRSAINFQPNPLYIHSYGSVISQLLVERQKLLVDPGARTSILLPTSLMAEHALIPCEILVPQMQTIVAICQMALKTRRTRNRVKRENNSVDSLLLFSPPSTNLERSSSPIKTATYGVFQSASVTRKSIRTVKLEDSPTASSLLSVSKEHLTHETYRTSSTNLINPDLLSKSTFKSEIQCSDTLTLPTMVIKDEINPYFEQNCGTDQHIVASNESATNRQWYRDRSKNTNNTIKRVRKSVTEKQNRQKNNLTIPALCYQTEPSTSNSNFSSLATVDLTKTEDPVYSRSGVDYANGVTTNQPLKKIKEFDDDCFIIAVSDAIEPMRANSRLELIQDFIDEEYAKEEDK